MHHLNDRRTPCSVARALVIGLTVGLLVLAACSSGKASDSGSALPTPTPLYRADHPVHILVIHSYHPENLWDQELNLGFLEGLAEGSYTETAGNLRLSFFWMDTARHNDAAYLQQISANAITYSGQINPDMVVTFDDDAVRYVLTVAAGEKPFVFAGLNADPESLRLSSIKNVTGVEEHVHINETLVWIKKVLPDARRLTFLFDASEASLAYRNEVSNALLASDFKDARIDLTNSYAEWKQYVLQAAQSSDVLVVGTYHTLRDVNDQPVASREAMQWAFRNSNIPIVSLWDFGVRDGALGGSVISGYTQGYEAALKVVQILNGESASDLGITIPPRGALALNPAAARRWNVVFPVDLLEVSTIYGDITPQ